MSLSDVPEEGSPTSPSSQRPHFPPYNIMNLPVGPPRSSGPVRKPSNLRTLGERSSRSSFDVQGGGGGSGTTPTHTSAHNYSSSAVGGVSSGDLRQSKRNTSTSSLNAVISPKSASLKPSGASSTSSIHATSPSAASGTSSNQTTHKVRSTPRLPHDLDIEPSPATIMYWSRAPVYGAIPIRGMRAHSVTLVDTVAWVFGGCDDRDCWKDVYCFDTETMQWSHPETCGDIPPPCRAHTATLVDRKIVVFGGGQGPTYYNSVYILDTVSRRWTHPKFLPPEPPLTPVPAPAGTNAGTGVGGSGKETPSSPPPISKDRTHTPAPSISSASGSVGGASAAPGDTENSPVPFLPAPRRAHTAVLYHNKVWVFGGGNGMTALNDLWTLDVGVPMDRMRWEEVETHGRKPLARGYHTANLVGNVMVVVGGSDGKECFSDIWCLNLDTLIWSQVKLKSSHRRLSHSATQVGSYIFIMGGHDATDYTSEVLLFNLVSLQYEARSIRGKAPSPRGYHAAILADSRLFVFGGFNGHTVHEDVYILDLAASAYLPQVTSFRIEG